MKGMDRWRDFVVSGLLFCLYFSSRAVGWVHKSHNQMQFDKQSFINDSWLSKEDFFLRTVSQTK